jgi:uncharacterized phage-associated protein
MSPRAGLLQPTTTTDQINPGLSLWLDEKRGSRQSKFDLAPCSNYLFFVELGCHGMSARYPVRTQKVLECILWLASERPGIDVYHIVKCAFYADKHHLNRYGRPVTGDTYKADAYGPLGQVLYNLLRDEPIEYLALGGNGRVPIEVAGKECGYRVSAKREPNLRLLSQSDVESLRWSLENYAHLSFDQLVELSHAEEAYQRANGGAMRYEDMLEATHDRQQRQEDLEEVARHTVL